MTVHDVAAATTDGTSGMFDSGWGTALLIIGMVIALAVVSSLGFIARMRDRRLEQHHIEQDRIEQQRADSVRSVDSGPEPRPTI